jgi:hemoglobin/transferrin/lactoferrin receptor protein
VKASSGSERRDGKADPAGPEAARTSDEPPASKTRPGQDGDDREPVVLDKMVITATRTEKDAFDVPFAALALDAEYFLHRRQIRTTPEVFNQTAGVMVQKTGHGQGSPYIRGFTGFRTLFLVDGIRLNNSVMRDGPNQYWNTVDPLSIDRYELVKGPGSVLFGSDAVGGTVNALARRRNRFDPGFHPGGRIYYRYASAEQSNVGRVEANGNVDDRFGFHVGITGKSYGDLIGGTEVGRQRQTGYHEWDGDLKLEYFLNPDEKLVLAAQYVNQDNAWRTHRTLYGVSWEGTTVGNELKRVLDQDRTLLYAQFHSTDIGGFVDTVRASVSYHIQEEERSRVRSNLRGDRQGFTVGTVGAWLQLESQSAIGRWTYGADLYHDNVNSFRDNYDSGGNYTGSAIQGPVADDATYVLAGLFVQDEIPISDRFDLILGARYNYARADADKVEDPQTGTPISITDRWSQLTGSARALYRLDEEARWAVYGGISQAFRAPNLSDLTRLDTARSNEIETPAPGLDPENFLAFELGVKTRHETIWGEGAVFYTLIDDMIVRTPTGRVIQGDEEVTKQNAGDGFVWGFELTLNWRFVPSWTAFGNFTWIDSQVTVYPTSAPIEVREPLDRQMPPTGLLGVRWDHPKQPLWVEGLIQVAGEADRLSTRDESDTQRIPPGGTPGYAVIAIRGGAEIVEGLHASLAIENLTNEDYRIHGSGVNEPGTNVVLTVDWMF